MRLLFVTLLILLAAQSVVRADDTNDVEKAVNKLGGYVRRLTNGEIYRLSLHGTKATDEDLKTLTPLLTPLTQLKHIDLTRTKVSDEGMKHLSELKGLIDLELSQTKVTDAGLKHLAQISRLTTLNLSQTKITDDGLKHLADLKG